MSQEITVSNFVNFHCDRKIVKSVKGCLVVEKNNKLYQLYIELIGKKLITLTFEDEENYKTAFNILNGTTKEEIKSKLKLVK